MENKWNGKNALWMLLYLALYLVGTAITCFTGAICSPGWAFPVVVLLGIAASVLVANLTARLFKFRTNR